MDGDDALSGLNPRHAGWRAKQRAGLLAVLAGLLLLAPLGPHLAAGLAASVWSAMAPGEQRHAVDDVTLDEQEGREARSRPNRGLPRDHATSSDDLPALPYVCAGACLAAGFAVGERQSRAAAGLSGPPYRSRAPPSETPSART